ncbi:PAS domain-containing hybrid sensor histidine kinase/response regulator [Saccharospirillum salsuginis]|uniref:histidine kinase n=1 Tax=Saccharospirillum salsuginis TaxID=418750 RepID=A0A918K7W9_9GAMM|nr:PAS domain-containing hybrid sensor histidine kinase/response regulator [Saccharospirillum salsuginis]GGX54176.1 hybrid sensor histidine kinase/response regulator [Saccharospirillum salsuginis]
MNAWSIFSLALAYVALLFGLALFGDRQKEHRWPNWVNATIYSLSLAVYCTSWTYYGGVGRAASGGWDFVPIYLGPILVFVFGRSLLQKLVKVGKRQNTTSIADFLASRYGKRNGIALLVTGICTLAGVPYIALQLKAVSTSLEVLTAPGLIEQSGISDTALMVALIMIGFATLFGTRQVNVSEHHRGMMLAIAFESMVKLAALITLALFVVFVFFTGPAEFGTAYRNLGVFDWQGPSLNFITQLILASGAILVLPRQFHVTVVENTDLRHVNVARWVFPIYLTLISLVILPITVAGLSLFPSDAVNADTYVLLIPQSTEQNWLSLLMFIGGFSASTAMIVITTLTLSTMLSNDVVLPLIMKRRLSEPNAQVGPLLILVRRIAIVAVILAAWLYHHSFGGIDELSTIGLLAFSLVVQLIPAMLGGLYWRKGNAFGAYAGMIAGTLMWAWTLMVPTLVRSTMLPNTLLEQGLFGLDWLRPEALFGFEFSDTLSHGVFFSLLINTTLYVMLSRRTLPSLNDRMQAAAYVNMDEHLHHPEQIPKKINIRIADLMSMLERFAGAPRTRELVEDFERVNHLRLHAQDVPGADFIRYVERTLAGVIGASSARAMMHSALSGRHLNFEDVVTFFDETTQAIQFNQRVLSATLENLDHGVSVIDRDMRLVAWNRKYLEMYQYPKGMIRVGVPVETLVRYNAEHGECGPGAPEEHVRRRLDHLKQGSSHRFIRVRRNGSVIEMRGNPLPGGGFVTTFNDITEFVRAQDDLEEAKNSLEARVAERTEALREEIKERERAEDALRAAKSEAERANASKTRFLALASHDILQPLNAARLYAASLSDQWPGDNTLQKLDDSLRTTEELMSTLLEIARLDGNEQPVDPEPVDLGDLFDSIANEFAPVAGEKGLTLRIRPSSLSALSVPNSLRRIVQNLVSNAIKYTRQGGVLLGARVRGDRVIIQVWDTGLGIDRPDLQRIFNDFTRLDQHSQEAQGVGLGLGVVTRLSQLLNHPISVKSRPGFGSCFEVSVPRATRAKVVSLTTASTGRDTNDFAFRVLVIDNEPQNVDALVTLLQRWGCQTQFAVSADDALQADCPDLVLLDYHLGETDTGLSLYPRLTEHWQQTVPGILITAHPDEELRGKAEALGLGFLRKPVKPATLRSLLRAQVG